MVLQKDNSQFKPVLKKTLALQKVTYRLTFSIRHQTRFRRVRKVRHITSRYLFNLTKKERPTAMARRFALFFIMWVCVFMLSIHHCTVSLTIHNFYVCKQVSFLYFLQIVSVSAWGEVRDEAERRLERLPPGMRGECFYHKVIGH